MRSRVPFQLILISGFEKKLFEWLHLADNVFLMHRAHGWGLRCHLLRTLLFLQVYAVEDVLLAWMRECDEETFRKYADGILSMFFSSLMWYVRRLLCFYYFLDRFLSCNALTRISLLSCRQIVWVKPADGWCWKEVQSYRWWCRLPDRRYFEKGLTSAGANNNNTRHNKH
jgi:hypothetical protein